MEFIWMCLQITGAFNMCLTRRIKIFIRGDKYYISVLFHLGKDNEWMMLLQEFQCVVLLYGG